MKKIRVIVVDDSALMRKLIADILCEDPDIEVVDKAANGKIALEKIAQQDPDVVTLDVEMPVMDGIETLTRIMTESPRPVIMISALTMAGANLTFKALELGAVDFITKPDAVFSKQILDVKSEIIMKVKAAAQINIKKINKSTIQQVEAERKKLSQKSLIKPESKLTKVENIVTIGISTGGPEALRIILPTIPSTINAAIVIVQHMPPGFTKAFAERMDSLSSVRVYEAKEGDIILPGRVFIAPGDFHMTVSAEKYAYITKIEQSERVNLFRPSIDVLMNSTADHFKEKNIGIIMTGMAHDGVEGMKYIKQKGGRTMAQDEATSIVFGMNKLSIATGAIDKVVALDRIVPTIMNWIE